MTKLIQSINQSISTKGVTKQAKHIPTTINNPYARTLVKKCFKCGKPDYRFNECCARTINLTDHKDNFKEKGHAQEM